MKEYALNVELRTEVGKNACHRLRSSGYIPAILYSPDTSEKIKVSKKEFLQLFRRHISESVLIDINIAGKSEDSIPKAFVKDYLLDPITSDVLHLDFYKITAGHKIRTVVSLVTVGTPEGVRTGGILEILERELEIECLPSALTEKIEIDVSNLQVGDSLHISDIEADEAIKFLNPPERVIVSVLAPHIIEEEVAEEEVEEEIEGEEGKKAEATKEEAEKSEE